MAISLEEYQFSNEPVPKMIFRWLGVAGIELHCGDAILVIDPYFTRAPIRNIWYAWVHPDIKKIKEHLPACDYVLVTHPH